MIQPASARTSFMSSAESGSPRRRRRRSRPPPPSRSSYQLIAGDEFRSLETRSMSPRRTQFDAQHLARTFSDALVLAAQGDLPRLKSICTTSRLDLNGVNRRGWRLVQIAAEAGHLHIVLWLLDAGVDGDARDTLGWSALMLAASRDCIAIIHALLQRGCQRTAIDAVRVATVNNSLRSLQVLLGRIHVHAGQCDEIRCPVRLAASRRHYGALQALLVAGYSTRCLSRRDKDDYEIGVVIKMAAGARRVLNRGLKGIIVSALIDDRGPMRISIQLMWSGIEVRLRRKRNAFFRKRTQPMLSRIGYDEQIRLLTHDGLVLGQMTVKLDPSKHLNSQHLIIALRQRQLAWSESYPIMAETNALVEVLQRRIVELAEARDANQVALHRVSTVLPDANSFTLTDVVRLAEQRLRIEREFLQVRERVLRNIQLANDIGTVLEVGQRLTESGGDFAHDALISGKQSRIQRELGRIYMYRTQLQEVSANLLNLDHNRERNATPVNPLTPTPRPTTPDGMCDRCGDHFASIAFESCRHVGLCQECGSDRANQLHRCRICHSRVDLILSKTIEEQL